MCSQEHPRCLADSEPQLYVSCPLTAGMLLLPERQYGIVVEF